MLQNVKNISVKNVEAHNITINTEGCIFTVTDEFLELELENVTVT